MQNGIEIRPEETVDRPAIRVLTALAFADMPMSAGTEAAIVDALRATGALALSLVAVENGKVVGHVAFSPVMLGHETAHWFGLGPISVHPNRQRAGIGTALVEEGLARLRAMQAQGCVVLGDPAYYRRFGFTSDPALHYGSIPASYLQRIVFFGTPPVGEVHYHPAFAAN